MTPGKVTFKEFLKALGPGIVTGASDDDPSGIATYSSAGAAYGFGLLWTALFTFPMMAAVQFICAKIGLVSGGGITTVLRQRYSAPVLWIVVGALVLANTLNLGVDIGAVAAGINLLTGYSIALLCIPVGLGLIVFQIFCSYKTISNIFKWLTLALFAYIGSAFFSHPDWSAVLRGTLVPHVSFDAKFLSMLVAILGTTISPYLFFWQANHEVEEDKCRGKIHLWQRRGASECELKYAALDVNTGMLLSNLVMFFIILSTGATLHAAGKTEIDTAAQAAEALRPIAGAGAEWLMALGLIGSGLLTVPVLAGSAAFAVAEALQWKMGLDCKPEKAKAFYAVIALSTLAGMALNFVGINPIKALLWTAVLNGFLAPPLLVIIMQISNDRKIMGDKVNPRWLNVLGWGTATVMFAAAIGLVLTTI